jgi:hypothetical protein
VYDKLLTKKDFLEKEIPGLVWQRMDDKVTCRIRLDEKYIYLHDEDKQALFDFFVDSANKMMDVFTKCGTELKLTHR